MTELRKVGDLSHDELRGRLANGGLRVRTGPFVFALRSPHQRIADGLRLMYAGNALCDVPDSDFALEIAPGRGWHRWLRPQARFVFDGRAVFEPLPAAHAFALLEWAMNWCISSHAHQYLILHAAVLARDGRALVMPAPPGSGKSTLCAALMLSGWRLLSDELTLLDMDTGDIVPLCRPVSLKNASIPVIRSRWPDAVVSDVTRDTKKGDVVHVRAPGSHLAAVQVRARPHWIVLPKYSAGQSLTVTPRHRAEMVVDLARNAFNFAVQGQAGFRLLCEMAESCQCLGFDYSNLDEAIAWFEELAGR